MKKKKGLGSPSSSDSDTPTNAQQTPTKLVVSLSEDKLKKLFENQEGIWIGTPQVMFNRSNIAMELPMYNALAEIKNLTETYSVALTTEPTSIGERWCLPQVPDTLQAKPAFQYKSRESDCIITVVVI